MLAALKKIREALDDIDCCGAYWDTIRTETDAAIRDAEGRP